MLAYPYKAVEPQDYIDTAREGEKVRLQSPNKYWVDLDEGPVS
jgi:hypothetical protein